MVSIHACFTSRRARCSFVAFVRHQSFPQGESGRNVEYAHGRPAAVICLSSFRAKKHGQCDGGNGQETNCLNGIQTLAMPIGTIALAVLVMQANMTAR